MPIEAFQGDTWTIMAAEQMLPILVQCARERRTIYYREAKELLFQRGISRAVDVNYGHPAGVLGDALNELAEQHDIAPYPPLNALVINKTTNLPGVGVDWYLAHYLGISEQSVGCTKRPEYVARVQDAVFAYPHWDRVLRELIAEMRHPVDIVTPVNIDEDESLPPFPRPRGGHGGEGPEHKRLKDYVAAHPNVVGLDRRAYREGQKERKFACADRADVFFNHAVNPVAVECKTAFASNDELTSGIFQCVKYEALLKAERLCWKTPTVILKASWLLAGYSQMNINVWRNCWA